MPIMDPLKQRQNAINGSIETKAMPIMDPLREGIIRHALMDGGLVGKTADLSYKAPLEAPHQPVAALPKKAVGPEVPVDPKEAVVPENPEVPEVPVEPEDLGDQGAVHEECQEPL
eukprot:11178433-Lingulodinium_polyedra.AAC.1